MSIVIVIIEGWIADGWGLRVFFFFFFGARGKFYSLRDFWVCILYLFFFAGEGGGASLDRSAGFFWLLSRGDVTLL